MQVVSFDPRYLDWVRQGTKTRTTRFGERVELGPATFRFESDPPVLIDAEVTSVRWTRLDELSDEDAAAENFEDAQALREALSHHYPGLPHDAAVSVISFELS